MTDFNLNQGLMLSYHQKCQLMYLLTLTNWLHHLCILLPHQCNITVSLENKIPSYKQKGLLFTVYNNLKLLEMNKYLLDNKSLWQQPLELYFLFNSDSSAAFVSKLSLQYFYGLVPKTKSSLDQGMRESFQVQIWQITNRHGSNCTVISHTRNS